MAQDAVEQEIRAILKRGQFDVFMNDLDYTIAHMKYEVALDRTLTALETAEKLGGDVRKAWTNVWLRAGALALDALKKLPETRGFEYPRKYWNLVEGCARKYVERWRTKPPSHQPAAKDQSSDESAPKKRKMVSFAE